MSPRHGSRLPVRSALISFNLSSYELVQTIRIVFRSVICSFNANISLLIDIAPRFPDPLCILVSALY
ncbi:hypothetical protein CBOM_05484 [Ceraceosorus bombacis]|uniref:Uncharacterized protein n=1 Tax=Ceraceosorus bombacis TaxID=401625 RepID=A0A0P1BS59_9BASI|nr:hypothetical protein CBOM_05484 [Ceraceosorus bombacis]